MTTTGAPRVRDNTPWGPAQTVEERAPGIVWVSTASHGGFWISQERRDAMPALFRDVPTFAGGNWYEEDCDAALITATHRGVFSLAIEEESRRMLRWFAERPGYERFHGLRYVA